MRKYWIRGEQGALLVEKVTGRLPRVPELCAPLNLESGFMAPSSLALSPSLGADRSKIAPLTQRQQAGQAGLSNVGHKS